jgi:hypothetical protein
MRHEQHESIVVAILMECAHTTSCFSVQDSSHEEIAENDSKRGLQSFNLMCAADFEERPSPGLASSHGRDVYSTLLLTRDPDSVYTAPCSEIAAILTPTPPTRPLFGRR